MTSLAELASPPATLAAAAAGAVPTLRKYQYVNVLDYIPTSEWAAIAAQTSTYDCLAAFNSAIAALPSYGGMIWVPPGKYKMSDTLTLDTKPAWLQGSGNGQAGGAVSVMQWPANKTGVHIGSHIVLGSASRIDGLAISGTLSGSTTGHGVVCTMRAQISNVQVAGFAQDGIHIEASVGSSGADKGNANNWYIDHCWAQGNGGHGYYFAGSDANAGLCTASSASGNGGWGFYDASFLGNTFVGLHTETNVSGPYKTDNANARSVFLGCYSETGQPGSNVATPSIVIGGEHIAGFASGMTGRIIGLQGLANDTPFSVGDIGGDVGFGIGGGNAAIGLGVTGDISDSQIGMWHGTSGCWVDTYAGLDGYLSIMRTSALCNVKDADNFPTKIGVGQLILPQTHWVYLGGLIAKKVTQTYASAAPTSGTWVIGDIVYNTAPAAGGTVGWICTAAGSGSPTTAVFKTWGAIAA